MITLCLVLIFLYMALLVGASICLHRFLRVPTFYTRKLLHIGTAVVWILGSIFIGGTWHMFLPNGLFFLFALLSLFSKPIDGLEENEGKKNYGIFYFAISTMLITAMNFWERAYPLAGLAFCCLTFGDGFAAVVGKLAGKKNPKLCGNKTLVGLSVCYLSCVAVSALFTLAFDLPFSPLVFFALAGFISLVELYTPFGLDNLTVPILALAFLMASQFGYLPQAVLVVCAVSPLFAIVTLWKKVFTPPAATLSFLLLILFAWWSGYDWVINIFVGYAFVLVAKLIGNAVERKRNVQTKKEKSGRRVVQVLANLLAPLFGVALAYYLNVPALAVGAFGAFACAIGDSMASDIGKLQKKQPFDICRFRRIETGLSGGVSLLGSCMAVLAVALNLTVCALLSPLPFLAFLLAGVAGILGIFLDSVLGSLIQAKYLCPVCGKKLETPLCCDTQAQLAGGFRIVNNNTVNVMSNFSALGIGFLLAFWVI